MQDAIGLEITAANPPAYDGVLDRYLLNRLDASAQLKAALAEDPDAPLLHVVKASFTLQATKSAYWPAARDAAARASAAGGNPREQAHAAAVSAWAAGELDLTLAIWEGILADHPHHMLAFRQHHFLAFWLGRPERMWQVVEGVLPRWGAGLPGYGTLLACRAFAAEECGFYTIAENAGREAVRIDPADPWAAHAVAHVLEMQGRHAEGIDWVVGLQRHWDGVNNLAHHLWWHRALHHIERQEWPMVLELYDKRFRNLGSPVTQLQPDLYIDMQNAASALFRLQLHEVHVGDRWVELADKGEARIGDCASPFSLPHFMMALAATHRFEAAQQMLAEMREFAAAGQGSLAPLVGAVALPVTEAVLAWYRGDFAGAVTLMHPVLGEMHRLGGSHAQQDVLEQLFVDAALKAGRTGEVRLLLERVAGRHPLPPSRCIGYARAAREIHF